LAAEQYSRRPSPLRAELFHATDTASKEVIEIITVFSTRLYDNHSRKNQKPLDRVRQAVEAPQC
jgi:predicted site-specific integrase-resolvase